MGPKAPVSPGHRKQELIKVAHRGNAILDSSSFLLFGMQVTWEELCVTQGTQLQPRWVYARSPLFAGEG